MRWWGRLSAMLDEGRGTPVALGLALLSAFGVASAITMLFWAARGVMDLGGFVAEGGPYEIAHPAPDWVWVAPVSIWVGMLFGGLNMAVAHAAHGPSLLGPAWSGLFLSLGWNFVEYGLQPPGGGIAWGWLVCAAAFIPMGAVPLWWMWRGFLAARNGTSGPAGPLTSGADSPRASAWIATYGIGIVAGVVFATWAFWQLAYV